MIFDPQALLILFVLLFGIVFGTFFGVIGLKSLLQYGTSASRNVSENTSQAQDNLQNRTANKA